MEQMEKVMLQQQQQQPQPLHPLHGSRHHTNTNQHNEELASFYSSIGCEFLKQISDMQRPGVAADEARALEHADRFVESLRPMIRANAVGLLRIPATEWDSLRSGWLDPNFPVNRPS